MSESINRTRQRMYFVCYLCIVLLRTATATMRWWWWIYRAANEVGGWYSTFTVNESNDWYVRSSTDASSLFCSNIDATRTGEIKRVRCRGSPLQWDVRRWGRRRRSRRRRKTKIYTLPLDQSSEAVIPPCSPLIGAREAARYTHAHARAQEISAALFSLDVHMSDYHGFCADVCKMSCLPGKTSLHRHSGGKEKRTIRTLTCWRSSCAWMLQEKVDRKRYAPVEVQKILSLPLGLSFAAVYACATYVLRLLFSPWLVYIYDTGPFVSFPSVCFFYLLSFSFPLSLSLSSFQHLVPLRTKRKSSSLPSSLPFSLRWRMKQSSSIFDVASAHYLFF